MKLSEHQLGIAWLRQFNPLEVHVARLFLDSLKLVSLDECEAGISKMVAAIYLSSEGSIGLFTIDKKIIDPASAPGSEDRLGHLMSNLRRQFSDRILLRPTVDEMHERKVKHIIFMDDFIGSGQRFLDFWSVWASKTVKSWLSNSTCKLWLAGYAIHESGIGKIQKRITYVDDKRICFEIRLRNDHQYWPEAVRKFCEKNGERTFFKQWPLGYGDFMCPLVFQHGCPDNCPAILWSNGLDFRALFPQRGIPHTLYTCFNSANDDGRGPELLWNAGQFALALALIDDMVKGKRGQEYISILTVLGLLLRGVSVQNLPLFMTLERSRLEALLKQAGQLGLVTRGLQVTEFGKDLVARSKKTFLTPERKPVTSTHQRLYFPRQFQKQICGVQPKSRNEPARNRKIS